MLLSKHVVNVVLDQVKYKAEQVLELLNDQSGNIARDKELTSKHVRDFIAEVMESLLSFYSREDREGVFNELAKHYSIKIGDENQKKKPMQIEMVRDNFNSIVSALKVYEKKQMAMEDTIKELQS